DADDDTDEGESQHEAAARVAEQGGEERRIDQGEQGHKDEGNDRQHGRRCPRLGGKGAGLQADLLAPTNKVAEVSQGLGEAAAGAPLQSESDDVKAEIRDANAFGGELER